MFDEIGKKIKKLAEVLCWIGIVVSIIITFVLWGIGADSYEPESYILSGLIIGILGSLISWIGSFFMYGFGELVDNSQEIKKLSRTESNPYKSEPLNCNQNFSSYTINNLKIDAVDAATSVGTCQLCQRKSVVLRECKINDGFSKMHRKLCEKCILEHGVDLSTNSESITTSAFSNNSFISASEIVSLPKGENTKMCLACGRVLPVTQKECPCGSESFDDDKNI